MNSGTSQSRLSHRWSPPTRCHSCSNAGGVGVEGNVAVSSTPDASLSQVWRSFTSDIEAWRTSKGQSTVGKMARIALAPYVWFRILCTAVFALFWTLNAILLSDWPMDARSARYCTWVLGRCAKWHLFLNGCMQGSNAGTCVDFWVTEAARYGLGAAAPVTLCAVGCRQLGSELIPSLNQGRFTVETAFPVGTPIKATVREIRRLQPMFEDHPDIQSVYATVGADQRADSSSDEGEHTARIRVQLRPGGDMVRRESQVMDALRERLNEETRMLSNFVRPALFSFKTPVELVIYGFELKGWSTRVP